MSSKIILFDFWSNGLLVLGVVFSVVGFYDVTRIHQGINNNPFWSIVILIIGLISLVLFLRRVRRLRRLVSASIDELPSMN